MADPSPWTVSARAEDLLRGSLAVVAEKDGWVRPQRVSAAQMRALGSVRAWHPGLFKQMAACASGIRLEFETDSSRVRVELRAGEVPRGSLAVLRDVSSHTGEEPPRADVASVDVDGRHLGPFALDGEALELELEESGAQATLPLPGMGPRRRVRVWLPCLAPCSVREVAGDGTCLEPVPARPELLVLGDSIAQGFVASDPARTWPALVAGHLGLDLVNQGIGAQVFQPGSLADAPSALDPAAIVVELADNYRFEPCSSAAVARDARAYLGEVSASWPDVPTWVLTTPPHTEALYPTDRHSCAAEVDGIIEAEVRRHPQMRLVRASALLDERLLPRLLADGSDHPGDAGQLMLAERLSFVMDSTRAPARERRAAARSVLAELGDEALPVLDALGREGFEPRLVDPGAVIVDGPHGVRVMWARDRKLVRRALVCLGPAGVTCVCGSRSIAREVARSARGRARSCHLAVWRSPEAPDPAPGFDVRPLGAAYAGTVRERYSHPEYLAPGELEGLLAEGVVLGGFERGRLVGFVGEHPEGSMGMLEVFEEARRRGWGRALAGAKIRQVLAAGRTPWAEVWPDNDASLALLRSMGLEVLPAEGMWFVS